jgi:beta-lactam-binding protein with PASTA domain
MRAISKRVVIASVPFVSLLIAALDPTPRSAQAVNEFASPPSPQPRPSEVLKTRIQEPRVPRTADRPVPPLESPRPPRGVLVPDLMQRPATQVAAILEHSGLRLGEQQREASEAPAGTVTKQTPEAGTRVRPGTTVDVDVAVPLLISVPDLTGHSLEQARALLARARLTAGVRRARPSEVPAGTVLTQSPIAGTRVRPGTDVDVTFAVPIQVSVPDVTGRSPQEAREILSRYRLGLGAQAREESAAPTGTVVSQSPGAGTRTSPGTAVNVAIAIAIPAPVPPSANVAPVFPPPPAPTAPRPPKPVVHQPKPDPVAPSAPAPSAPVVVPPPMVVAPAVAVTPPASLPTPPAAEPRNAPWPRRFAWGLGSALLLAAGGAVYYRRTTPGTNQQPSMLPTLDFAQQWDTGIQRIGPAGPLRNGSGLRLVSGLEMGTSNLEDDHLVGAAHDTGGLRQ